jgi:hypothetical protein
VLLIITAGFAAPVIWIVYGFIGNGAHKSSLLKKGYLTEEQWSKKDQPSTPILQSIQTPQKDRLTQLKELGELRDNGVLTDDEFTRQKAKLLGT